MIYFLDKQNHIRKIRKFAHPDGKILMQIELARYNLPIPESIVIKDMNKDDLETIKKFIKDMKFEYQLRSENVGANIRYSETSVGLNNTEIMNELKRKYQVKDNYILLQKLPLKSISRTNYSCQFHIQSGVLRIEIRTDIATYLARCGWPPSETYEIPLKEINDLSSLEKYHKKYSDEILKMNLYLDSSYAGLRYLSENGDFIRLNFDKKLKRKSRLYEYTRESLSGDVMCRIRNKKDLRKFIQKGISIVGERNFKKWLKEFGIEDEIDDVSLIHFLSIVGFLYNYNNVDKHNSLRNRLRKFIIDGKTYDNLEKGYVKEIVSHAFKIKEILKKKIAKISITYSKGKDIILYWDLISWKK